MGVVVAMVLVLSPVVEVMGFEGHGRGVARNGRGIERWCIDCCFWLVLLFCLGCIFCLVVVVVEVEKAKANLGTKDAVLELLSWTRRQATTTNGWSS